MVTILHPITPLLASAYKEVRLRALQDTPSAFGSTYLRESQFSEGDWNLRVANFSGERGMGYLAFANDAYGGIAGCFLREDDLSKADLVSMWVAPDLRRAGVGRLLVDAIEAWAREKGAQTLLLMVTSKNDAAMDFYRRLGFSMTGRTEPYPNDPELVEYEMAKAL
jgi:ribosomal protein S18 acetylase RimI-like enzyme